MCSCLKTPETDLFPPVGGPYCGLFLGKDGNVKGTMELWAQASVAMLPVGNLKFGRRIQREMRHSLYPEEPNVSANAFQISILKYPDMT